MQRFSRSVTINELRERCEAKAWKLDTELFNTRGHDHVCVIWFHSEVGGSALFNTASGVFFGALATGEHFTSSNESHEKEPWFQELLKLFYVL